MRRAAALVIGNEILSGKVEEANVAVLARALFGIGVSLERVIVCPDEPSIIADDLNALRATHDYVFTSGGVGPTHDDVTVRSIAHAFGREIVFCAEVAELIREWNAKNERVPTDDDLRMAEVVEGTRLLRTAKSPWPTMAVENVYILPGVPSIFRSKLQMIIAELDRGDAFHSCCVRLRSREGDIARTLHELCERFPSVSIGSYPQFDDAVYTTKVTFDSKDAEEARAAAEALRAAVAPEELVEGD